MFKGFGLSVRGTIAGFERYPPDAYADSPLKEHFGRMVYETIVRVEQDFIHDRRDLQAKHWAILARRGEPSRLPSFGRASASDDRTKTVTGPWDVAYLEYNGRREGRVSEQLHTDVRLRNQAWRSWSSNGIRPIHVSYHWASAGTVVVRDGLRTALGPDLQPGEERSVTVALQLPDQPGQWDLQIDMVEEHVTWFSEQGQPPMIVTFSVRR